MIRLTPVVQTLLLINVAMLAVPYLVGGSELLSRINDLLALRFYQSPYFTPYQFFTYMFAHVDIWHLLFNMLGLVFFGNLLEQVWGSQRFLAYYMICGLGAGVIYLAVNYFALSSMQADLEALLANTTPAGFADFMKHHAEGQYRAYLEVINQFSKHRTDPTYIEFVQEKAGAIYMSHVNGSMIGASGAVYGILLACGMLFPNMTMIVFPIPIPIKAKYLVIGLGVMALYNVVNKSEGDSVAHLAHLGGMVIGLIVLLVWSKGRWPEPYN